MQPMLRRLSLLQAVVFALICGFVVSGFLFRHSAVRKQPVYDFRGRPTKISDLPDDSVQLGDVSGHTEIISDAHLLPDADAFLPHFRSVINGPNVTFEQATAGCPWTEEQAAKMNFDGDPDSIWAKTHDPHDDIEYQRGLWQKFIANDMIPYAPHKDRFSGRGIVILAGTEYTIVITHVLLEALNKLGSKLDVEIHHYGDELEPQWREDVLKIRPNVYFRDLKSPENIWETQKFKMAMYQYKTSALMNSRFAEIILLDSDIVPAIDPELLFESDTYKKYGTIFWPDISRSRANHTAWGITNTPCKVTEYAGESGQLVVDKRKYFYHLQLVAWWANVHGENFWFRVILGDKDLFRFAWHALKTKFGYPAKWLTSVGTLHNGEYCGHSFAQHHPDGRIAFMHGGLLKTYTPALMRWYHDNGGAVHQYYQRSEFDEQHEKNVEIDFSFDGNFWLPDRPDDMRAQWCLKMRDVEPRPLEEVAPGFTKLFNDAGGFWSIFRSPPKGS